MKETVISGVHSYTRVAVVCFPYRKGIIVQWARERGLKEEEKINHDSQKLITCFELRD